MRNKKVKILQFPIANSNGGITHYILNNWKWMDKEKFQCDFVTMSRHLDFVEEILATGSNVYYISCYAEDNKEQFIQEFAHILENGYDVVHLHTKQWKSFLVEDICRKYHIPKVIVHSHNTGIDVSDPLKRKKEIELHEQIKAEVDESIATDFWACSELAADFLFGKQIPKEKIKIMPNAIDVEKFEFNDKIRKIYRKLLGIEGKFVIGNIGRLVYQKNQEFILKVFKELCVLNDNFILLLIGNGERELALKKYVKDNCLENKVIFLGMRKDVECLLQAIDVFVLPSRFEGLPIGAIEAQAAGLKCLCSDRITKEVKITDNLQLIPLKVELWKNEILEILDSKKWENFYKRKNFGKEITQNGYNISMQIKVIEKEYMQ